jgi:hypothetical protein
VRAWSGHAHPDVFDIYPYASTSAVYLETGAGRPGCATDADYFIAWLGRVREAAAAHPGYNTAAERDATLAEIDAARAELERRR